MPIESLTQRRLRYKESSGANAIACLKGSKVVPQKKSTG